MRECSGRVLLGLLKSRLVDWKFACRGLGPCWAQASSDSGMSVRCFVKLLVQHGRQTLQKFLPHLKKNNRIDESFVYRLSVDGRAEPLLQKATETAVSKPSLTRHILKWCVNNQAADLRRNAAKRLMLGGKNAAPYLGFVGVNLVTGYGLITKQDEMDKICEDIRLCLGAQFWENQLTEGLKSLSLDDLELGKVIDKGCNAIVHAAKLRTECCSFEEGETEIEEVTEVTPSLVDEQGNTIDANLATSDNPVVTPSEIPVATNPEDTNNHVLLQLRPKFDGFPLAVKMMFNYDAESNATSIFNAMAREVVPAKLVEIDEEIDMWEKRSRFKKKYLPPHPNIVDLQYAFVDRVPLLTDAMELYPDALPRRLNFDGSGRNMTLFLIMKRYHCNLQQYLTCHTPSFTTRLMLLTQLLEGVVHLVNNSISHRDLKPDNILLDLTEGLDAPQLVLADFGCCLADERIGLKLPYFTELLALGGNSALMAPEVATASPGMFTFVDYTSADLWSVGALAYLIFGLPIPFYQNSTIRRLDSRTYQEEQLPEFPNHIPKPIANLVFKILQRNPKKRPSAAVAANICHLQLWGPQELTTHPQDITVQQILHWLVSEAAISLCQASQKKSLISRLRNTFLGRVKIGEVTDALQYFQ